MRVLFKCLILGVFFMLSAGGAYASGAVLEAIGGGDSVSVKRAGKDIKLNKGDALNAGDELKTDGNTAVDIRLADKSIVRVGANSIYTLEEDSKVKSMLHRLLSGIVRVIVPPSPAGKTGPQRFRMDTPEGTIGVRGTEFVVIVGQGETTLKGFEGEVMFGPSGADFAQADQFVMVTEKFESTVRKGGKPSAPKAFDRTKYLKEIDGKGGAFAKVAAARKMDNYRQRSAAAPQMKVAAAPVVKAPVKSKGMSKKIATNKPVQKNESPDDMLFRAAANGNIPGAEAALKKGADVNHQDADGHSPLHAATIESRLEMVTFLVKKGADVNAKNKLGETPLMIVAAETGDPKVAFDLIELGAKIDEKNKAGATALEMAQAQHAKATEQETKARYADLILLLEGDK